MLCSFQVSAGPGAEELQVRLSCRRLGAWRRPGSGRPFKLRPAITFVVSKARAGDIPRSRDASSDMKEYIAGGRRRRAPSQCSGTAAGAERRRRVVDRELDQRHELGPVVRVRPLAGRGAQPHVRNHARLLTRSSPTLRQTQETKLRAAVAKVAAAVLKAGPSGARLGDHKVSVEE
jgi:hypothetical protein